MGKKKTLLEEFSGMVRVSEVAQARIDLSVPRGKLPVGVCYRKDRNCFSAYVHVREDGKQRQIREDCPTLEEAVAARALLKAKYKPKAPIGGPPVFERSAVVPLRRSEDSLRHALFDGVCWLQLVPLAGKSKVDVAGRLVSSRKALGLRVGRLLVDIEAAVMAGLTRERDIREGFLERVQEIREEEGVL